MGTIIGWYKKFQEAVSWIIAVALAALLLVILLQTFTRYVIFHSLPWSEELSRYLYVLLILLGINIGVTNDGFVRIDLLDFFLSDRMKRVMGVVRDVISLFVSSVFLYSTLGLIKVGAFQKSPAMQIRMQYVYMVLFAGFALCVISGILKLAGRLVREESGAGPAAEGGTA